MKIALVYDRVNKWGGAESVLLALHEMYPEAPLFTSVYDSKLASWAKVFDVRTSFLQKLPLPKNAHEYYPFLMGIAFESYNFDEFDVVISVTSEFAKAIITKPRTLHVCYCLNPTSYLWSGYDMYFSRKNVLYKEMVTPIVSYLRWYDRIICHRPDKYIAISKEVQRRIGKHYEMESEVVYPPVKVADGSYLSHMIDKGYYLVVSRLVPNKRIDIAVKAFNKLGLNLKIVGVGREEGRLKGLAKSNIEFLGNLTDEELAAYYRGCRALIVPGEEDFGIVAAEGQSFGKPVIAFGAGGALETVTDGKTGWLFKDQTVGSLVETFKRVNLDVINPKDCVENAQRFSQKIFKVKFKNEIEKYFAEYQKKYVL